MTPRALRAPCLYRDTRGAALIEFAIVAPVLCLLLIGGFDIAHTLYTRAILQGIVQKVARDASLETGTDAQVSAALDARVTAQVSALTKNPQIVFTRRFYRTFSLAAAAQAESYTDTNKNGTCDAGEPYVDANNNTVWDSDGGDAGQGGAKDRTLYTVTVAYPHMFPLWRFLGTSSTTNLVATTILQNQPYSDQASYAAATVRNCP
ncbi:TadE/TadG family type IV pilus assembly protein [Sphingomonas glacialis]|uniref:Pilus assembly protein n=1 Tax=Sphingomonas glacialis TaxID=658225 RepID=A0A502FYF7_9SPHN|nr:TadE family protein [Sphingomonas glacialis]TPG54524.1 pilus assembly protein [Sphingomonas glacialis]